MKYVYRFHDWPIGETRRFTDRTSLHVHACLWRFRKRSRRMVYVTCKKTGSDVVVTRVK